MTSTPPPPGQTSDLAPLPPDGTAPGSRASGAGPGLSRPYVLYPAPLEHPRQHHLAVLHAFAASPASADHVLVLSGPDWGAGDLVRGEAARLGLADRVTLLGYTPPDLLRALIVGADVLLCFSLPGDVSILQALLAGKVVIAADPELVGGAGISCAPDDAGALAAAIGRALGDEVLRRRAREKGPRQARHVLRGGG